MCVSIHHIKIGVLHEFLASFLENNVSKKDRLGVIDSKLGGSIQEELDVCFTKYEKFIDIK